MPETATTRNLFPKDQFSREQVEEEAARRRDDPGVISATVEEEGDNWVLVTVRQII